MDKLQPGPKLLAQCISSSLSEDRTEFHWEKFFITWFRENGTPLFFLFRKHLGVTNVQYAELFHLVQKHIETTDKPRSTEQLVFQTTDSLKDAFHEAIGTIFDGSRDEQDGRIIEIASIYYGIFSFTVAVDMFYCSCAVYLPPGLSMHLEELCARSGYIHSAGQVLYVRNIKKSKLQDLEASIRSHLDQQAPDEPTPFVVYAHEDFSRYDSDAKEQISRGIDATKLYIEKMSMGNVRLSQVVEHLRESFPERLEVPAPGSYKTVHRFKGPRAIWLVGDRSISRNSMQEMGPDRYYICYQQYVKVESPFYLFDENKPGWKSHTTLPHSLTAGLLNIALPKSLKAVVCDPFGGTGTTWLECKRLGVSEPTISSDMSPLSTVLVSDNLRFFAMSISELRRLSRVLDACREHVRNGRVMAAQQPLLVVEGVGSSAYDDLRRAEEMLSDLKALQPEEDQEFEFSEAFAESFSKESYVCRLLFYICLRAHLRYQGGLKRNAIEFSKALEESIMEMTKLVGRLTRVYDELTSKDAKSHDRYGVFQGTYSPIVVPKMFGQKGLEEQHLLASEVLVGDARNLKEASVDIILCDPPYGFNTTEDGLSLANLYSEFLDSAIRALKPGGHLMLVLPADSYTGRGLPFCTNAGLVVSQVCVSAWSRGRRLVEVTHCVPNRVLSAPYYWEAEKALKRTILHFVVEAV